MVSVEQYFSGIINFVFLVLGILNSVLGGLLSHKYIQLDYFVDPIVWIIPLTVLFLGTSTIIMSILGCYGMAIESKWCSISYFVVHFLIITAEIAVGAYWLVRTENVPELITTTSTFGEYSIELTMQWTQMQMEMNCCGPTGAYDYQRMNFSVPKECCIPEPTISTYRMMITVFDKPCEAAYVQKRGCDEMLQEAIERERIFLSVFCFAGALVKIGMIGASFLIPFEEIVEIIGWSPVGSSIWVKSREQSTATAVI